MIKKVGSNYNVYNEEGTKLLGSHATHSDALKQLQAIEASKARGGKPRPEQLGEK